MANSSMAWLNLPNHACGLYFKPYKDFRRRQTLPYLPLSNKPWRLLYIHLLLKVAMKKDILNIKLVEIPIIIGSQRNKKPNICHLSNRGKSVGIVHTIGLGIPFNNKVGFQPSNGSIGINLHYEYPTTTNCFLHSR